MKFSADNLVYPGIFLIILLSFFTFSENFFPLLTSDMAVNILMTPSFSLPHDIYFWGQDRSGNLIPFITHYLYTFTGWAPVFLVSIVHYLVLTAGFLALTRFVKSGYGRICLALIWFFPPWHFLEFLLILYGIQASCVLLALNFLDRSFGTKVQWKCLAWLSSSCLMFIVAVWVSDMALISLFALLLLGSLYYLLTFRDPVKLVVRRGLLVPAFIVAFWLVAGYLLLHYAKSVSTPVQIYNKGFLADPVSLVSTVKIVYNSVIGVFLFASESSIESVYSWVLLLSIPLMWISKNKHQMTRLKITENPWFYFFLFEAILTLAAVIFSSWVAANGAGRRYFTTFFISAWISLIIWLENAPKNKWKTKMKIILAIVVVIGSLSGCVRFYYPQIKPSRIRILSAMRSMGDIGIIAEYWNSYLTASPDPVHIKATPHDKDYVRNPELATEVFLQSRIYLIKDGWLESFPDSIVQFGRVLKKRGNSIHLADSWLNRYEVVKK